MLVAPSYQSEMYIQEMAKKGRNLTWFLTYTKNLGVGYPVAFMFCGLVPRPRQGLSGESTPLATLSRLISNLKHSRQFDSNKCRIIAAQSAKAYRGRCCNPTSIGHVCGAGPTIVLPEKTEGPIEERRRNQCELACTSPGHLIPSVNSCVGDQ